MDANSNRLIHGQSYKIQINVDRNGVYYGY